MTFVFGSDVMMTVAQGFEAPMKILMPIRGKGYAMLGIGDIIIPGFLCSMCLRADFIRGVLYKAFAQQKELESSEGQDEIAKKLNETPVTVSGDDRFYYLNSIIAYNIGIAVTMAAMEIT